MRAHSRRADEGMCRHTRDGRASACRAGALASRARESRQSRSRIAFANRVVRDASILVDYSRVAKRRVSAILSARRGRSRGDPSRTNRTRRERSFRRRFAFHRPSFASRSSSCRKDLARASSASGFSKSTSLVGVVDTRRSF